MLEEEFDNISLVSEDEDKKEDETLLTKRFRKLLRHLKEIEPQDENLTQNEIRGMWEYIGSDGGNYFNELRNIETGTYYGEYEAWKVRAERRYKYFLLLRTLGRIKGEIPIPTHRCPCGQLNIIEQCYIQHRVSNRIIVVGSICIEKFWKVDIDKFRCIRCGNKYERNYRIKKNRERDDFMCDLCFAMYSELKRKLRDVREGLERREERKRLERERERLERERINMWKSRYNEFSKTIIRKGKHEGLTYIQCIEKYPDYCYFIKDKYGGHDKVFI